jgi:hypothetical protein
LPARSLAITPYEKSSDVSMMHENELWPSFAPNEGIKLCAKIAA